MKLPRIELYCDTCGSTNIGRDACAHWDVLKQKWVFTDVYDCRWCSDCGSECIEEREYPELEPVHPATSNWDDDRIEHAAAKEGPYY